RRKRLNGNSANLRISLHASNRVTFCGGNMNPFRPRGILPERRAPGPFTRGRTQYRSATPPSGLLADSEWPVQSGSNPRKLVQSVRGLQRLLLLEKVRYFSCMIPCCYSKNCIFLGASRPKGRFAVVPLVA